VAVISAPRFRIALERKPDLTEENTLAIYRIAMANAINFPILMLAIPILRMNELRRPFDFFYLATLGTLPRGSLVLGHISRQFLPLVIGPTPPQPTPNNHLPFLPC
jgi:hypothetical protein